MKLSFIEQFVQCFSIFENLRTGRSQKRDRGRGGPKGGQRGRGGNDNFRGNRGGGNNHGKDGGRNGNHGKFGNNNDHGRGGFRGGNDRGRGGRSNDRGGKSSGRGGHQAPQSNKPTIEPLGQFEGVFTGQFKDGTKLLTQNLVPGHQVYGEKLHVVDRGTEGSIEYREWDPYR